MKAPPSKATMRLSIATASYCFQWSLADASNTFYVKVDASNTSYIKVYYWRGGAV